MIAWSVCTIQCIWCNYHGQVESERFELNIFNLIMRFSSLRSSHKLFKGNFLVVSCFLIDCLQSGSQVPRPTSWQSGNLTRWWLTWWSTWPNWWTWQVLYCAWEKVGKGGKEQINLLVSKCKSPALRWVLLPVLQMHYRAHNSCVEFKLRSEETIVIESLLSRANAPCKPKIQPAASFDPGDSSAGGVDLAILLAASQGANTWPTDVILTEVKVPPKQATSTTLVRSLKKKKNLIR